MAPSTKKYWTSKVIRISGNGPEGPIDVWLEKPYAIIGSLSRADLVLPAGKEIGRRHLFVQISSGRIYLVDFVSGQQAGRHTGQWYVPGQSIVIGDFSLVFEVGGNPPKSGLSDDDLMALDSSIENVPVMRCRSRDGKNLGDFDVKRRLSILGNHSACTYQFTTRTISSEHCVIYAQNGRAWVIDLQSAGKTIVNGRKAECSPITPGSKLRFGRIKATLEMPKLKPMPGSVRTGSASKKRFKFSGLPSIESDQADPPSVEPNDIANSRIQELERELDHLNKELAKRTEQEQRQQNEYQSLQESLENQRIGFQNRNDELTPNLVEQSKIAKDLAQDDAQRTMFAQENDEPKQALASQKLELEKKPMALREKIASEHDGFQNLSSVIQNSDSANERLRSELTSQKIEFDILVDDLKDQLKKQREKYNSIDSDRLKLALEIEWIRTELADKEIEFDQQILVLKNELDAAKAQQQKLLVANQELETKYSQTEVTLSNQKRESEQKLCELQSEFAAQAAQTSTHDEVVQENIRLRKALDQQKKDSEQRLEEAKDQLNQLSECSEEERFAIEATLRKKIELQQQEFQEELSRMADTHQSEIQSLRLSLNDELARTKSEFLLQLEAIKRQSEVPKDPAHSSSENKQVEHASPENPTVDGSDSRGESDQTNVEFVDDIEELEDQVEFERVSDISQTQQQILENMGRMKKKSIFKRIFGRDEA